MDTAVQFSDDYLAGLIDAIGRVRFDISKSSARSIGYDARPRLRLNVGQQELLDAILVRYFEEHDINYSFRRQDTNGRFMLVERNADFRTIDELLGDRLIQLKRQLAFVLESYLPNRQSGELASKTGHLSLVKSVSDLQPGRDENENTKYTPTYFAHEFGIELASQPRLDIPSVEYRDDIGREYLAGFFDGRGWTTISIGENDEYSVGLSSSPRVELSRPWPNPHLATQISNIFVQHGIQAQLYNEQNNLLIVISRLDDIERFLELVVPEVWALSEQCQYFFTNIFQRYRHQDHHSKQGLYEIVKTAEPLFRSDDRQYSAAHFEEIWEDEITVRSLDSILENPLSDPGETSVPDTYLPEISAQHRRRKPDSEYRHRVLSQYDSRCVITGIDDERLLEVAHIVPWADDPTVGRDVENVLVLNPLHHEAYDRGFFIIDESYVVHVAPNLPDSSDYFRENVLELDGTRLEFPQGCHPNPAYLSERNSHVTWYE